MRTVLHIVSASVNPRHGGLEQSVIRIAEELASHDTVWVVIYTFMDDESVHPEFQAPNVILVPLLAKCRLLETPLSKQNNGPEPPLENFQVRFLVLRKAVRSTQVNHPDCRHLLISFFISRTGFITQQVAESCKFPHIACVRGSDFNRDFYHPNRFAAITHVARSADCVVAANQEQANSLRQFISRRHRIVTIPNSVLVNKGFPIWKPHRRPVLHLVSDCGYSFKKGTHILLASAATLKREGMPITLTIVGNTDDRGALYWQSLKKQYSSEFATCFFLKDWVPRDSISTLLLDSDVYCSATLGEGSSTSRLTALALGMPVVTSACGEIVNIATGANHVRLSQPGDQEEFTNMLRLLINDVRGHRLRIRQDLIGKWRSMLDPIREAHCWRRTVVEVLKRVV
jgi:glycosyltransferase involved in cell wall biosynthesis